jgi:hypothetical protein
MTNYFVDSANGSLSYDGTTMDSAFLTIEQALESGLLSAGDIVWVRRGHTEVPASDIGPSYDGQPSASISVIGWPRPAITTATITGATWTNGSVTVSNITGLTITRIAHQGRYVTAPDGKRYLITDIVSSTSIKIDREYAGSTVSLADGGFTILADEDWYDDMGTQYGFDDSTWTIKETAWDADAHDLPRIDFNDGNFNLTFNGDNNYTIKNLEFIDSADGNGIVYMTQSENFVYVGCLFKQNAANANCITISYNTFVSFERCIIEGSGTGALQWGIRMFQGPSAHVKNSAIYNMGDYGIYCYRGGTLSFDGLNVGIEVANSDDDIYLDYGQMSGKDLRLGGSNGDIFLATTQIANTVFSVENHQKILGNHYEWRPGGEIEKVAVSNEATINLSTAASPHVIKLHPNDNVIYFDDRISSKVFVHEYDATTVQQTWTYYVYNDSGVTLNTATATDDIWLDLEYVDSGTTESAFTTATSYSTETNILDAADANDWDTLSVANITPQPTGTSRVRITCYVNFYHATGKIYVDPLVVMS